VTLTPYSCCCVCVCDRRSTTACHLAKQLLCTDACGCCAGRYSPTAALAAAVPEANAVEYNGLLYRTLDDVTSPLNTCACNCQNYYLGLPSGWALAADNADSIYVIRSYRWGTQVMLVANGYGYYTASEESSAGQYWSSGYLYTSGSTYKAGACNLLILISKTMPCTACPAGESRDSGARVREAYVCEFGEDRMLHQNI
jgi:hypothetical protein